VLAVTLLLALNPAEAQKRTRDTKRLRDVATLQAIINQYLESGVAIPAASCLDDALPVACNSNLIGASAAGNTPQPCNPAANNGQARTFVSGASPTLDTTGFARYQARVTGSDYEVNVRLEAESNRAFVSNDGGPAADNWYEVFSSAPDVITH
ncbi:MAG TPA: hypothetical protein VJB63_01055, partial [Patescibacteria group bacterium]|nr:hypothetical protein [Patescibacteria group bacterium]